MKNHLISAIIWAIVSLIWIGLAISKIVSGDDIWIIALNVLVAVLSVINAVLNFRNHIKKK